MYLRRRYRVRKGDRRLILLLLRVESIVSKFTKSGQRYRRLQTIRGWLAFLSYLSNSEEVMIDAKTSLSVINEKYD